MPIIFAEYSQNIPKVFPRDPPGYSQIIPRIFPEYFQTCSLNIHKYPHNYKSCRHAANPAGMLPILQAYCQSCRHAANPAGMLPILQACCQSCKENANPASKIQILQANYSRDAWCGKLRALPPWYWGRELRALLPCQLGSVLVEKGYQGGC